MHLLPFYTRMHGEWLRYAKSTSQFHWRFLLVRDVRGFQVNPLCRHDITRSDRQIGKACYRLYLCEGTHLLKERAISFSSGFSGPWDGSVRRPASSLSPTTHFRGRHSSPRTVRDPGSSVRMPQNAPPSVPSTPTPFRCTTTGTSIVPLEPLAQRLEAWLTLPSLSRWLTRTIRLGYAIQFARRPPEFNGVLETSVAVRNAPVLREEIAVLLAKDAIEPVPPAEMRQGFYSPYFIVPKKGGGLRPILDLRVLNRALHKLPFKMLTHRRMIKCIQPQDWFAAIDLKDAYFHVSILPRHRPFLRFAFEGRAWQYRVLPFCFGTSTAWSCGQCI